MKTALLKILMQIQEDKQYSLSELAQFAGTSPGSLRKTLHGYGLLGTPGRTVAKTKEGKSKTLLVTLFSGKDLIKATKNPKKRGRPFKDMNKQENDR